MLLSILFYYLLVGYIFFWLTDYFVVVIGLTHIESMITFICLLFFAIVIGLILGGKIADDFVYFLIQGGCKKDNQHRAIKLSSSICFSAFLLFNCMLAITNSFLIILLLWIGMVFGSAFVPINTNILLESVEE